MAIVRLPAAANDNVSIGMVRLPTAVFVAMDRGYFAAEGLNVTPVFSQSGGELVPALSTGRIDVAVASPGAALFTAFAIGVKARIVADCWVAPHDAGGSDYAFIDARADLVSSGRFTSPRDAKGLTFAITARGQMTELFAAMYLQRAGLRLSDVHVVELPFPDMEVAMRNHAIDLAATIEPYATLGSRSGASVRVAGLTSLMPGYVQDSGVRFMRAFVRANAFLRTHLADRTGRRQIARIYQKYIPLDDPAIYEQIGLPVGPADMAVDLNGRFGLAWQLRRYVAEGLIAGAPSLEAAVDNGFVRAAR